MRGNDFLDKMELVDPAYVEAADSIPQKRETEIVKTHGMSGRVRRTALIAAVLAVVLMGSAFAVWSIHAARQQELRADLQIDDNDVAGYVEYEVPDEASGLVLLSALNEGDTQRAYVNISPVEEEEFADYLYGREFRWSIDGTGYSGFADPNFPSGVTLAGLDEIRAGVLQHAYDKNSKTLTLTVFLKTQAVKEAMETLGSDEIPLSVSIMEGEKVIRSFGPVPFALTEEQMRVFDFGNAVYHDAEFGKDMEITGLELTPFRAVWKVRFDGEPTEIVRDDLDMPLPDRTLMEEKLCRGAEIIFSDGTGITTGGAIGAIREGDLISLPCGWDTAVNINDVERIVFGDLILWKR